MKTQLLLLFAFFLCCSSCNMVDSSEISVEGKKVEDAKHLGQGVWMKIPSKYRKAESYDGYQAPQYHSSLSVKTSQESLDRLLKVYEEKNLKAQKCRLLELRPVVFEEEHEGYYVVVQDFRKKTIRHLLAVKIGETLYKIKGFYFKELEDQYETYVRNALLSSHIGEVQQEEERFKFASFIDLETVVLTTDGKFPTESPDSLYLSLRSFDNVGAVDPFEIIRNELQKHVEIDMRKVNTVIDPLQNGKIYINQGKDDSKACLVMFVSADNNKGSLYTLYGERSIDLKELKRYLKRSFTEIKIPKY